MCDCRAGLSPLTRGSRLSAPRAGPPSRSIPAHTGKPSCSCASRMPRRVYPRPHGEANVANSAVQSVLGLSPPTRGSHLHQRVGGEHPRSIPAHTGKPRSSVPSPMTNRVYPRPHGEAARVLSSRPASAGLSPPTRGSRHLCRRRNRPQGSIPAHTGKPTPLSSLPTAFRVYPRPHGEAAHQLGGVAESGGLSPPTRGSRFEAIQYPILARSIPAHTGKPRCKQNLLNADGVYPRPHGEASMPCSTPRSMFGLSPPTRGSRAAVVPPRHRQRSIPAHTGKPASPRSRSTTSPVYPRPHGEAVRGRVWAYAWSGLSPPTRGSPDAGLRSTGRRRSIPAHTGKPEAWRGTLHPTAVYPRPHGEATRLRCCVASCGGLSPPTRGSR